MLTKPSILLHLEGAAILACSAVLYSRSHASWTLFAILFLAPDLAMLGYLANRSVGAAFYNLAHTLTTAGLMLAIGYFTHHPQWISLALIWTAHIGFDRLLGYGLKYPTAFKDTHLQRV